MDKYFKSTDLHLSCYLLASGRANLIDVERIGDKPAQFIFESPKVCEELAQLYFSHQATIDPFAMSIALRELKARLYSARKEKERFENG